MHLSAGKLTVARNITDIVISRLCFDKILNMKHKIHSGDLSSKEFYDS